MKYLFPFILTICLFIHSNAQNWQQVGGGLDSYARALYADTISDQLYIGGALDSAGGMPCNDIASWNGTSYNSLNSGNSSTGSVEAIVRYNGDIVIGGHSGIIGGISVRNYLQRWNGFQWDSFPGHMRGGSYVEALNVYNGDLIVGGDFLGIDSVNSPGVIRWDGSNWSSMNMGIDTINNNPQIFSFEQFNGNLYIGGAFRTWTNQFRDLCFYDDHNFYTANFDSSVVDGIIFYQNQLYVTGVIQTSAGIAYMAKWDGFQWINMDVNHKVWMMRVYNNLLFAVGNFTQAGTTQVSHIAYWDGTQWHALSPDVFNSGGISALAMFHNELYVAGSFTQVGSTSIQHIAKYIPALPVGMTIYDEDNSVSIFPNPCSDKISVTILNGISENSNLEIFNSLGETVVTSHLQESNHEISLNQFTSGIYFLKLSTGSQIMTRKIVKL